MKRLCCAAFLALLVAGCASPSPPPAADTNTYMLHAPDGARASKPPRLTVGVSDPDTQLILPWLLKGCL
ncbi:hypothetical protein [Paraburkholderia unamae]|uniref:Uncharacterized protein n=1 Tax=Paraburkholderia unamae TaxID=219649 RepID=A0ACC6RPZ6_9BURK